MNSTTARSIGLILLGFAMLLKAARPKEKTTASDVMVSLVATALLAIALMTW